MRRGLSQLFGDLIVCNVKYGMITCGDVWWAARRTSTNSLEVSNAIDWSRTYREGQPSVLAAVLYLVDMAHRDRDFDSSEGVDDEGGTETAEEGENTGAGSPADQDDESYSPPQMLRGVQEGGEPPLDHQKKKFRPKPPDHQKKKLRSSPDHLDYPEWSNHFVIRTSNCRRLKWGHQRWRDRGPARCAHACPTGRCKKSGGTSG